VPLRRGRQEAQQAAARRRGERDQADGPPGPPAAARVSSRKAWASRHRVTWRCHPAQERPSSWSRPTAPFARSHPVSLAPRVAAERASAATGASSWPEARENARSVGAATARRTTSHDARSGSVSYGSRARTQSETRGPFLPAPTFDPLPGAGGDRGEQRLDPHLDPPCQTGRDRATAST
jgi:hypothetical protein